MSKIAVLLGLFVIFGTFIIFSNFAFAAQANPTSNANKDFPKSIKVGEKATFSLRMSNPQDYIMSDIKPVIEIIPKNATNFVHVEISPQISTLIGGFYQITHGTIYVDKGIPAERIFVSVSFMGKNQEGEQVALVSPSTFNASIKIEKSQNEEIPNGLLSNQQNNEKLSCTNPDSKVPLYGCSDVVTVKIDSPLQQFKSGIPVEQIQCKQGLMLVKKNDNRPVCVKQETLQKLQKRGWTFSSIGVSKDSNAVVPRGDLFLVQPLRIEGLDKTQHVGQKIQFTVKYNGTKSGCQDYPRLHMENSDHKTIWKSGTVVTLCDPDMKPHYVEKIWKVGDTPLGTPIINQTGFYTLFVEFENDIIQQDFWVKPSLQPQNIADLSGKSFYYYTINETLNSAQGEGKKVTFHDVTFTLFPRPMIMNLGGFCGSGSFRTSILFSDGTRESLEINIPEAECMDKFSKDDLTKLTNHTNPQAGLTFYDGKVMLLIETSTYPADNMTKSLTGQAPDVSGENDGAKLGVHYAGGSASINMGSDKFNQTAFFSGNVGAIREGLPVQVSISDPYDLHVRKYTILPNDIASDGSFNFTHTFVGKYGQDVYTLYFSYDKQKYELKYNPIIPP